MGQDKKIGILTFHCVDNFGAVLQCYALQSVISELGLHSEVVDYCPPKLMEPFKIFQNPFAAGRVGWKGKIRALAGNMLFGGFRLLRRRRYSKFRKANLNMTGNTYLNVFQLDTLGAESYSHYVAGSDQVWNGNILGELDPVYFLGFAGAGVKRIAYAVSLGEEVSPAFYPEFRKYVPLFDSVSVREKSAQAFVQGYTDKPVHTVLDPTFLIPTEKWRDMAVLPRREKYIFVYDIWSGPEMSEIVDRVSLKLGLRVISYSDRKLYKNGSDSFYYEGPSEFLGLLLNADFVVTSSYHGTTLSIINKKKFVTVPHPARGARMADLLEVLGLSSRLVKDVRGLEAIDLERDVDYSMADKNLPAEKEKSLSFLKAALK